MSDSKDPKPAGATEPVAASSEWAQKSKADLRRERREIQEAQRAKKAAGGGPSAGAQTGGKKPEPSQSKPVAKSQQPTPPPPKTETKQAPTPSETKPEKEPAPKPTSGDDTGGLVRNESFVTAPVTLKLSKKKEKEADSTGGKQKLFHHFDQYSRDYSAIEKFPIDNPPVHPAFIKFGIQSAHERINGSNSRCLALLNTMKIFLLDYRAPAGEKPIPDDLEQKLKTNIK